MTHKSKKCVICKRPYTEIGNVAEPLKKGFCCDRCNELVIIERILESNLNKSKNENSK